MNAMETGKCQDQWGKKRFWVTHDVFPFKFKPLHGGQYSSRLRIECVRFKPLIQTKPAEIGFLGVLSPRYIPAREKARAWRAMMLKCGRGNARAGGLSRAALRPVLKLCTCSNAARKTLDGHAPCKTPPSQALLSRRYTVAKRIKSVRR